MLAHNSIDSISIELDEGYLVYPVECFPVKWLEGTRLSLRSTLKNKMSASRHLPSRLKELLEQVLNIYSHLFSI